MSGRFHRFQHGGIQYTVICELEREVPPGGGPSFINAPAEELRAAVDRWVAESGTPLKMAMNILVAQVGDAMVVVDTGNGPNDDNARSAMVDGLEAAGIDPAGVHLVISTHGHGDHIGGNTDRAGNPTFPNATYVMSEQEWQRLTAEPNDVAQRQLLGLADRYRRMNPGDDVIPGIGTIPAPGHAEGMMALVFGDGDDKLLHVADTFHLAFQPGYPDWYISFDGDPDQTVRTRRRLLAYAAESGHLVMAYHTPFPGLGRIEVDGDAWRWHPVE
ncbi:MAG: MBL fold metallo-hydrolase [Thermomicrobiales bacterium]|nr:MBL fold metallo-hydrolase [Thermomicrobiales bacterium]